MNNNSPVGRTFATIAVWFFYTAVSAMALGNSYMMDDWAVTTIVLVTALFALIATLGMWVGGSGSTSRDAASSEKAKRGSPDTSKYALLIEMMDEDERAAFKESLKRRVLQDLSINEDGELSADAATLEALLEDEGKRRYQ